MAKKNYAEVSRRLSAATSPMGSPSNPTEALAIYLVGCAVSLLQKPTAARLVEVEGLLVELGQTIEHDYTEPLRIPEVIP